MTLRIITPESIAEGLDAPLGVIRFGRRGILFLRSAEKDFVVAIAVYSDDNSLLRVLRVYAHQRVNRNRLSEFEATFAAARRAFADGEGTK